ncbi:MAG: C40 family peptidase [Clostridia bacterium]|nr:C40 family peptidase [Clostridia bacterium]
MKTNTGLVDYARSQLEKPYWYGTFGNTASKSLLNAKRKQYPSHYGDKRLEKYKSQYGERVHDCVGLIKGYLWSENPVSKPKYDESQDVSANGMLKKCTEKGKISTMPEMPGILVFKKGHVGIYVGNKRVIEARGFNYGVVETSLGKRGWTDWGKCPWISYPAEGNYFMTCAHDEVSIVDALKSIGEKSSFDIRKKIAAANGMPDYSGSEKENVKLLSLLRTGMLIKP